MPSEAEQLEEKDPALGVARVLPELGAQRLDRLVEPAGLNRACAFIATVPDRAQADTSVRSQAPTAGLPLEPSGFCGV